MAIWTSFALAMLCHFGVGAARSFFTGRGIFRSGMDMFLVGLGVAGLGYLLGDWIVRMLDAGEEKCERGGKGVSGRREAGTVIRWGSAVSS